MDSTEKSLALTFVMFICIMVISLALRAPARSAPDCQKYFDAAVMSVEKSTRALYPWEAQQAAALRAIAYLQIYQACRDNR